MPEMAARSSFTSPSAANKSSTKPAFCKKLLCENEETLLLGERSVLNQFLAKCNDIGMLCLGGSPFRKHGRRIFEYDEAALCTLTTRNGTFVFAQKFFLRLGGLA